MSADAETVIFENARVKVTNLRAVIDAKIYAMSDVVSVEMTRKDASSCIPVAMMIGGGLWALVTLFSLLSKFDAGNVVPFLFAAGLVALGYYTVMSAKPTYAVKIRSASGESSILESKDKQVIERIVAAMTEAIVTCPDRLYQLLY